MLIPRLISMLVFAWLFGGVSAQGLDASQINTIKDAAKELCQTVQSQSGSRSKSEIKGDINLKILGLARVLVEGRGGSNIDVTRESYEGLSQRAMEIALMGDRDCRERLFIEMLNRIQSPQDKRQSYLEERYRSDLRAVQQYLKSMPVHSIRALDSHVCQAPDQESVTSSFQWVGGIIKITNYEVLSNERCEMGPRWRREITRMCSAKVKDLDDLITISSPFKINIGCLSGDCFDCAVKERSQPGVGAEWVVQERGISAAWMRFYVGGESHVQENSAAFKVLARSLARLISTGSDEAFCGNYTQYCF